MQIGENIRKFRKEKNMTQEEMARRLGVTPPAVNKWENGNSCPDIMLLAPIARLLDISVDTLLSFQGELTDEEIKRIVAEADRRFKDGAFEEAFGFIKKTLEKYPNCDQLVWQLALMLDGYLMFREVRDTGKYDLFISECYTRALESKDEDIRYSAAEALYNFYLRKEKFEEAEKYLEYMSRQNPERKRMQALIFGKTGRVQEAYKAYEELLFADYQIISVIFNSLCMLAIQDEDMEKAHYYVEKQAHLARFFEMGDYYEVTGRLELAAVEKDEKTAAETAEKMLSSVERIMDFTVSPLYGHMVFKETNDKLTAELKQSLINCFKDQDSFGFMKDNSRWQKLIERFSEG